MPILNPFNTTGGTYSKLATTPFDFWGAPVITADDGTLACPGFVGKTLADSLWDKVFINSAPTPGLADVQCTKARDFDKKKATGRDGARITWHGIDPAMDAIRILIWTPDQLKALNELWPILFPKKGKGDPTPFDVQHPIFKFHDVKSIQVIGGEGPAPGPIPRSRMFTIRYVEFSTVSKKKVTVTPVASKGSLLDSPARPTPGRDRRNTGP